MKVQNIITFCESSCSYLFDQWNDRAAFRMFTAKQLDKLVETGKVVTRLVQEASPKTNWKLMDKTEYKMVRDNKNPA